MTGAQRDELERLRMKASSPEMVTVPRELLRLVIDEAENDNRVLGLLRGANKRQADDLCLACRMRIDALRKAAGIE